MKATIYAPLLAACLFCGCVSEKQTRAPDNADGASAEGDMEITPIEIKTKQFFWMLEPWKDGQLATIDGWGRFSAISFEKNNKITIRPLINFPRTKINGVLRTWPEANLLWTMTEMMMHVADVELKKSKSFIPLFCTGVKRMPVLIDADAGVILFQYHEAAGPRDKPIPLVPQVYYNYKTDTILSIEEKEVFYLVSYVGGGWYLRRDLSNPDAREVNLYHIRTKEVRKNALTRTLNELEMPPDSFSDYGGLCLAKWYITGRTPGVGYQTKLELQRARVVAVILCRIKT